MGVICVLIVGRFAVCDLRFCDKTCYKSLKNVVGLSKFVRQNVLQKFEKCRWDGKGDRKQARLYIHPVLYTSPALYPQVIHRLSTGKNDSNATTMIVQK